MIPRAYLFLILAACTGALAQQSTEQPVQPQGGALASAPASANPSPIAPIYGVVVSDSRAFEGFDEYCRAKGTSFRISGGSILHLRGKASCKAVAPFDNVEFLEVLHSGKSLVMLASAFHVTDGEQKRLDALTEEDIARSLESWKLDALKLKLAGLKRAVKALEATEKYGVAITLAHVYDVSEHTEGTGFEVTVINSGKKTIKYVTFSIVGVNAVGDPVRGSRGSGSTVMLRGIGPIEPDGKGLYSKDYLWMTDIVEAFKISQVRLEFTDGSSKTIRDVASIELSEGDYEALTAKD